MNRKSFDTSLVRQARLAGAMTISMLEAMGEAWDLMSMKEYSDIRRIILTGCGDSYCAAVAAKPVFEAVTKVQTQVMPCIEVSRLLDARAFNYAPNGTLVIGISVSGTVSRVEEALLRASRHGANTVAVTADAQSPVARAARHVMQIKLPEGIEDGPGSLTYNGSIVALIAVAFRMGRARNVIPEEELWRIQDELKDYVRAAAQRLSPIEERAFDLARTWKDLRAYDFIGDYGDYATAFFGAAKIVEAVGGYATYDDSEDWCHINFFLYGPRTIGRIFIANEDTPSFGRLQETMAAVDLLHSPCIVITDAEPSAFPERLAVLALPKAKRYWMSPLMQHFAFDLVVGYMAGLIGTNGFGCGNEDFEQRDVQDTARIRSNEIVIV